MSVSAFLSRLWRETKRRRVPQMLVAYLGLAVLTIEGSQLILENLGATEETVGSVASTITIFWVAFFPLALALSWLYQVVPDRGAKEGDPQEGESSRGIPVALVMVVIAGGCMMLATNLWVPNQEVAGLVDVPRTDAIAFLPPEVLRGGVEIQEVADCLVNRIEGRLMEAGGLEVDRVPKTLAAAGVLGISPDSAVKVLGVRMLVTSTAEGFGDSVRVTFRLVDVATRAQVEAVSRVIGMPDADAVVEEAVDSLAVGVRRALGTVFGDWAASLPEPSPRAQVVRQQVQAAEAAYRSHMRSGDVDAALASLDRADSVLVRAMAVDPVWAGVRRIGVAHARALTLLPLDRPASMASLRRSLVLANQALEVAPGNPEALRLRGVSQFRLAARDTALDAPRASLLAGARADLLDAQGRHRNQSTVLYTLAQVMAEEGDLAEAYMIATDAYDRDAFISAADRLLLQLAELAFQLSRDDEAAARCLRGGQRFPTDPMFAECHLRLMAWGAVEADTVVADSLRGHVREHYPPAYFGTIAPHLEALEAGVHVQVGDTLGARSRLELVTVASEAGTRLTAAGVWLLMGEREEALDEVRRYVEGVPGAARYLLGERMLEPLRGDARFRALVAGG